jgi:heat-inducible transcriptional repressor
MIAQSFSLSPRERFVLQSVVRHHILTAQPVSSKALVETYNPGVAPSTIRNIFTRLEELGLLSQPHVSAGRVPTEAGYKYYINQLMEPVGLPLEERKKIEEQLFSAEDDVEVILEHASQALSYLSRQLGITLAPKFDRAILEKLELVSASHNRVMLILLVRSGLIKAVLLEMDFEVDPDKLGLTSSILNERLSGLSLRQIRKTGEARLRDVGGALPVVGFILKRARHLFDFSGEEHLHYGGTANIMRHPEFQDVERLRTFLEFIEESNALTQFLTSRMAQEGIKVTIGRENIYGQLRDCSLITSTFQSAEMKGMVAVLGPMRMRYSVVIPLVRYTSDLISQVLSR